MNLITLKKGCGFVTLIKNKLLIQISFEKIVKIEKKIPDGSKGDVTNLK